MTQKTRNLGTIVQICRAESLQATKACIDNRKKAC